MLIVFMVVSATEMDPTKKFWSEQTGLLVVASNSGPWRGLEISASAYAAYLGAPLIMSGTNHIPTPLMGKLLDKIVVAGVDHVIIFGPCDRDQIRLLEEVGVVVHHFEGTKFGLVAKLARSYPNPSGLVLTVSNPSAAMLGAHLGLPVLVLAEEGGYGSAKTLPREYLLLIKELGIRFVYIVDSENILEGIDRRVSPGIIGELQTLGIQIFHIRGKTDMETSILVSSLILRNLGEPGKPILYCGFYGELPPLVPLVFKEKALMVRAETTPRLEDIESLLSLLDEGNIGRVVFTRNQARDYLLMEEPDHVPTNLAEHIEKLVKVEWLTPRREINEAFGLYSTELLILDQFFGLEGEALDEVGVWAYATLPVEGLPPIVDILCGDEEWVVCCPRHRLNKEKEAKKWVVTFDHAHPIQITTPRDGEVSARSRHGYGWDMVQAGGRWVVNHVLGETTHYRTIWEPHTDHWVETHPNGVWRWYKTRNGWICAEEKVVWVWRRVEKGGG
ncbi:MAG: hypothetical protein DRO11_01240 [Methanobacteriota archaeon]|nr:MAG: hypothetical protein DRO11_01240 [Euryarchaeota archaeon]